MKSKYGKGGRLGHEEAVSDGENWEDRWTVGASDAEEVVSLGYQRE